ncbi:hypothetical protein [Rhodococcus aetherivorans]|uniref:hypothetical protein n=1 Tax=Rhodococcus aetherivorans TaxID=191292 RepID=UPI00045C953B|nr:hypothetical protein [Rhodococcus aetherivorans]KDE14923.1 hypothetical protein N505_0102100 [Rhodococcus aetherivorans]
MAGLTLTPDQESRLREWHACGRSLRGIARDLEVTPHALSRWCKRNGLVWTGVPAAADVVRRRLEAGRLQMAEQALADAIHLRERIWEEHTVVLNTPDGPREFTLDLPDAKAVSEYAAAIERLIKSHVALSGFGAVASTDHAKSTLAKMHDVLSAIAAEAGDAAAAELEPPQ